MTNQADVNRKEWSLAVTEAMWYFFGVWLIGLIIVIVLKDCCPTFRPNHVCLADLFGFFGCCGLIYVSLWVITKYWEGVYINDNLTETEILAPTQSIFIFVFYIICLVMLCYLTIVTLIFSFVGICCGLFLARLNDASVFHRLTICLGIPEAGAGSGTFNPYGTHSEATNQRKTYLDSIKKLGNQFAIDSERECMICLTSF